MSLRTLLCTMFAAGLLAAPAVTIAQEGKKDKPAEEHKDKPAEGKTDKPKGHKPADPHGGASDADMAAMMAAMMPGPAHAKLAKLAGDWTVKSTLSGHSPEPEVTDATAKITMTLDGRFLQEDYAGIMMGMPFTSRHLLGFNNGAKKYEGVWVYTHGTSMMMLEGESKDDGKTITFKATYTNEANAKETMEIVYTITDDDHFTILLKGHPEAGQAGPHMEMVHTRKK